MAQKRPPRGRNSFKKTDAVRGGHIAHALGYDIDRIDITQDRVSLIVRKPGDDAGESYDLDRELAEFENAKEFEKRNDHQD